MSQQKDIFFQLLTPSIERLGYTFKKSKGIYVKTICDLDYIIEFSWDGRGGATHLNCVYGTISMPSIIKASKKIIGRPWNIWYSCGITHFDTRMPVMYSQEMALLFRDINLKKMAEIPFEKKYPFEKIEALADVVEEIIKNEIVPNLSKIKTSNQILDIKLETIKKRLAENDVCNFLNYVLLAKLLCVKLNREMPDYIASLNLSNNQTIDAQWNMQTLDYDLLDDKIVNYLFK